MEHSQFVWWLTGGEYQLLVISHGWKIMPMLSTSGNGDTCHNLPILSHIQLPNLRAEIRQVCWQPGKGYKGVTFPNSMPVLGMIFPLLIMMRSTRGFLFEMLQCSVAATRAIPMSSTTPNIPGLWVKHSTANHGGLKPNIAKLWDRTGFHQWISWNFMGITMNYNDVIMENPLIFPNRDDLMEKSRVQQVQHQQNVGFNTGACGMWIKKLAGESLLWADLLIHRPDLRTICWTYGQLCGLWAWLLDFSYSPLGNWRKEFEDGPLKARWYLSKMVVLVIFHVV